MVKDKIILDSHKLFWHRDRIEAWLRGERIAPITIDIALTRNCNYKCTYCYSQLQNNKGKLITKKNIKDFIDDCAEIGVKGISLVSDGESAYHKDYIFTINYGKSRGIDMAMGTNGYFFDEESLNKILPDLTYLRFNISAGLPESYAKIHGVNVEAFYKACENIKTAVKIKKEKNLDVTIGLQMVLLPEYAKETIDLAILGRELGTDYLVIKHCSDDENGSLNVNYEAYDGIYDIIKEAETYSTDQYLVKAKWSKIKSHGKKRYAKCYGAPFMTQMSGTGLVAPCGFLFNDKYKKKFHVGNICDTRFKDIWQSNRYWEVMNYIISDEFDARTDCGTLCLQHKVNEFLWDLKNGQTSLPDKAGQPPIHINFI